MNASMIGDIYIDKVVRQGKVSSPLLFSLIPELLHAKLEEGLYRMFPLEPTDPACCSLLTNSNCVITQINVIDNACLNIGLAEL
jgi:hypothetical protein